MTFDDILAQVLALLQREQRLSYRALQRRFALEEADLEALKDELIYAKRLAVDEADRVLVWVGDASPTPAPASQAPQSTTTQADHQPEPPTPHGLPAVVPPPPEAERRQLTILFCDLVGSTALSRQLDPEDYRAMVRAYQAACAAVIERFDGHIAQYLGDGLLVYFGYPLAHEDDAQRAVHTGLEIVQALGQVRTRLARDQGLRLAVRLGIHTGLVVVGEMGGGGRHEQLALGETPNVAARLQELAAPDTVVLSAATYQLVQGLFACQLLGGQPLKGLAQPMPVYCVLGPAALQSRFEVAASRGLTPFVGRAQEVELLLERWEQAKEGSGQVVVLSGEAGIGKSRLVQEVKTRLMTDPHTQLECRGSPYHQHSALYPVIELVQRRLAWQQDDTSEAKLEKLAAALALYRFPTEHTVPLLASLLSLPLADSASPLPLMPQQQKQQTLAILLAWLMEEAGQQPVLYIVEDLHWIDPSTLEFLTLLVEQAPTARLLLLLTGRPEFQPPWVWRAHLSLVTLNRLRQPHVVAMVTHATGDKPLPAAVLHQVVTQTDGVPLFVEELTKTVLESGLLQEHEDHYVLTGPLPSLVIPTTLQDALMARLDRLAAVKVVAQLGATLGRTFPYELLQAMSQLDEQELWHGLAQLVQAEVLYQRGVPPHATYTFKHALIQEAAYQSLLKSTRQQYHQRTAQVLAERFPDIAETQPELLAYHCIEAGLVEPAVGYWQRAGERARRYAGQREAVAHFSKGLDVLQTLPDTPVRTQQELGLLIDLGIGLGDTKGAAAPEVAQVWARARALCQQTEDTPRLCIVLTQLRTVHTARAEHQTARELAEQALTLAQRLQNPHLLVLHYSFGITLLHLGDLTSARGHFEQAMAHYDARRGGPQLGFIVQALGYVAQTLWVLGYPDQALQRHHEALTMLQQWSHPGTVYEALYNASGLHWLRREVHAVHERTEAAMALASEQGSAPMLALLQHQQGWVLAAQGRYEEGQALMRQGLAALRAMGEEVGRPRLLALLAEAYGKSAQTEAGLRLLAEALALVDNTGERQDEAEVYRLKGELLLWQAVPEAPAAEACFQRALAVARRQQARSWELRAAMSLSRLWQRQGKRAAARELLADIYGWFTEGFDTPDLQEAKALLEELAQGA